ncbi:gamma-glutamylhydrolase [Medicago truncatula]|uniref:folate gamma-glutamyl hydrolase n=1 Tax=Medicago truncatula TaxID=3880 RepID=G7ITE2_MEDTR|nr:gamma-glutamylhydrolase [Medicago truncatula]
MSSHFVLYLFLITIFHCFFFSNSHLKILLPTQLRRISSSVNCPAPDSSLYYQPVIGILSHPGDGASGRLSNATDASYLAASYVKFVEAGGARVVPLIYTEPWEILLKKVLEKNDAGDYFPLYATCLGFELITMIVSEDNDILEDFAAENQASSLQFVENVNIKESVFQRFPPDLLKKLSTDCIVMQNHQYGISPVKLLGNQKLSSFFEILTTSNDQDDKVYVSTVRSRNYPVTGFQWHPEKNAFEWGSPSIPHTEDAIRTTQYAANYLVSEARKSLNRPVAQELLDNLIYNYRPTYCGYAGKGFDEVYIFE